jgi:hypothetical protein
MPASCIYLELVADAADRVDIAGLIAAVPQETPQFQHGIVNCAAVDVGVDSPDLLHQLLLA